MGPFGLYDKLQSYLQFSGVSGYFWYYSAGEKGQTGGAVLYLLASSDGALYIINLIIAAPRNSLQLSVKKSPQAKSAYVTLTHAS